jgi:hypothetical protein
MNKNRIHTNVVAENKTLPSVKELILMLITFVFTVLAWVFFRAENITHAFEYLSLMANSSLVSIPKIRPTYLILLIAFFLCVEWFGRQQKYAIERLWLRYPKALRWIIYLGLVLLIFLYGGKEQEFIYFQF